MTSCRALPERILFSGGLILVLVQAACVPARAQAAPPQIAPYTRLSDDTVLRMGLSTFTARFGKNRVGEDADDLLHFYAGASARHTDKAARTLSADAFITIARLRRVLREWDAARFSPTDRYVGGQLEEGHADAASDVDRENFLSALVPLLKPGVSPGRKTARTTARNQFRAWLSRAEKDNRPSREQLEGLSAEEQAEVHDRYRAWYGNLTARARELEDLTDILPAMVAVRLWDYARYR